MGLYLRRSPIKSLSHPSKTEMRDGWEVVLEYEDEGNGPFLTDLSHIPKWDVQDANLSHMKPWGDPIPERPGESTFRNGTLISRVSFTQAIVWHLLGGEHSIPQEPSYTDVTDAYALMALLGRNVFCLIERVTWLDLSSSSKELLYLIQGPVLRVPCSVAVLGNRATDSGALIACSRGYAQSMADAFLDVGAEWGLRTAGEKAFCDWLR